MMTWAEGKKVAGKYFGVDFTGTIEHARPHTINHHLVVIHVTLDAPIEVYGDLRAAIAMHVTFEGRAPEVETFIKEAA